MLNALCDCQEMFFYFRFNDIVIYFEPRGWDSIFNFFYYFCRWIIDISMAVLRPQVVQSNRSKEMLIFRVYYQLIVTTQSFFEFIIIIQTFRKLEMLKTYNHLHKILDFAEARFKCSLCFVVFIVIDKLNVYSLFTAYVYFNFMTASAIAIFAY